MQIPEATLLIPELHMGACQQTTLADAPARYAYAQTTQHGSASALFHSPVNSAQDALSSISLPFDFLLAVRPEVKACLLTSYPSAPSNTAKSVPAQVQSMQILSAAAFWAAMPCQGEIQGTAWHAGCKRAATGLRLPKEQCGEAEKVLRA